MKTSFWRANVFIVVFLKNKQMVFVKMPRWESAVQQIVLFEKSMVNCDSESHTILKKQQARIMALWINSLTICAFWKSTCHNSVLFETVSVSESYIVSVSESCAVFWKIWTAINCGSKGNNHKMDFWKSNRQESQALKISGPINYVLWKSKMVFIGATVLFLWKANVDWSFVSYEKCL